jgi:hypothetical protein
MLRNLFLSLSAGLLFSACSTPSVVTAWKLPDPGPHQYQTILLVGVIKEDSLATRTRVENYLSAELKKLGYQAPTALATFGPKGLASLPREETLVRLCNIGIDAVLTIALIDGEKEKFNEPVKAGDYPASHFLDRIWNYSAIQADLRTGIDSSDNDNFWEIVLFDLYTLQPHCVLQTRATGKNGHTIVDNELAIRIVAKLQREKAIKKWNGNIVKK